MNIRARLLFLLLAPAVFACGDDNSTPDAAVAADVGRLDAEPRADASALRDAQVQDALPGDIERPDLGEHFDAMPQDAAPEDAAEPQDAEPADAEPIDAGFPADAAPVDAGFADAAAPDAAGQPDAQPIDAGPPDAGSGPSFARIYEDIIEPNCSCHVFGAPNGLAMPNEATARANLIDQPSAACTNRDRVEPGDSTLSAIMLKLGANHVAAGCGGSRMPLGGAPLSAQELQLIADWIDAGAP